MTEKDETSAQQGKRGIRFSLLNTAIISVSFVLAIALIFVTRAIGDTSYELRAVTNNYIQCENAATEMREAANYLSTQARMFILTAEPAYLRRYLIEDRDTQRQQKALDTFKAYSDDEAAEGYLDGAVQQSNALGESEQYALKLIVVANDIPPERGARELENIELTAEDAALSSDGKTARAKSLLFDESYQKSRDYVDRMVDECEESLEIATYRGQETIEGKLNDYLFIQSALALALLASVLTASISHVILIRRPLDKHTAQINRNEPLEMTGAAELQHLAHAYNSMYEENRRSQENLLHEAEHDSLTGLLNRSAYDKLYAQHVDNQALLLIDMDYFKDVNDDYGHDVGDKALIAVANILRDEFRSTDHPCRIGGDEFAVIMPGMNAGMRHVVEQRLVAIAAALAESDPSLPRITLSMGVAFSEDVDEQTSLYKAADLALYSVKESGRNGHAFYSDMK